MSKKNSALVQPLFFEDDNYEVLNQGRHSFSKENNFHYKYTNENIYYSGEIALWKAVILQAAVDLKSNSKKKIANTYRIKALMWFSLKNKDFLQVCNWAGLDPLYVYKKIKPIKEKTIRFFYNNPEQIS